MSGYHVVFVTVSSVEEGKDLAMQLIGAGLAPCVNIVPSCVSVYQWKGQVRTDNEALLLIKSDAKEFDNLREAVERAHSYDVPEIIAVPLERISDRYRGFLDGFFS